MFSDLWNVVTHSMEKRLLELCGKRSKLSEDDKKEIYKITDDLVKGKFSLDTKVTDEDEYSKDKWGYTSVMLAAKSGELEVVQYLVERGASIIEKDIHWGKSAIILAAFTGHLEVVKYLHSRGASLMDTDRNGATIVMFAAMSGKLEVIKYLESRGASLIEKTDKGFTAVMFAAEKDHLQVLKYLDAKGASLIEKSTSIIAYSGQLRTALDFAKRSSMTPQTETLKWLEGRLDGSIEVEVLEEDEKIVKPAKH